MHKIAWIERKGRYELKVVDIVITWLVQWIITQATSVFSILIRLYDILAYIVCKLF